jgi:hypothetical protein
LKWLLDLACDSGSSRVGGDCDVSALAGAHACNVHHDLMSCTVYLLHLPRRPSPPPTLPCSFICKKTDLDLSRINSYTTQYSLEGVARRSSPPRRRQPSPSALVNNTFNDDNYSGRTSIYCN